MLKVILYSTLLIMFFAVLAVGQSLDRAEIQSAKEDYLGLNPANKPFSLIDLSRVKWSHSYSVTYFSGSGTSGSLGLYTGAIFYELTPSLSLDVQLGIAHNPGSFVNRNIRTDAAFYPSINLDYHPSRNFRISLGYVSYPGINYNPYYPYRSYNWRR
jgi:hypothetical protein